VSDELGLVFGALADPTRRWMVQSLLSDGGTGTTSVPALAAALPISRQAVAKHVVALGEAGLLERAPSAGGREVHYRLRAGALDPAAEWIRAAETQWDGRLARLRDSVERARD
jgi:DNA-binding transcriptional ArsR family regulator